MLDVTIFYLVRVTLTPEFLWAQRKDQIYLTVNVPNVRSSDAVTQLTDDGHVYFKGSGGNVGHEAEYILDINLLKGIKAEVRLPNLK